MPKKGKARPAGGTARRAEETTATANDQKFSRSHNTTSQERVQAGFISQFLLAGAGQGLHLRDLVKLTGRTEREVRQMIQAERLRGIPILSDNQNGCGAYLFCPTIRAGIFCPVMRRKELLLCGA